MEISWANNGFKIKGKQAQILVESVKKIVVGDFEIFGPGEYEIAGVTVVGVNIPPTAFRLTIDGISIGFLDQTIEKLTQEQVEKLDGIDVLLGVKIHPQLVTEIEPVMVITLEQKEGVAPVTKLNITRDKLPTELQTVVLE